MGDNIDTAHQLSAAIKACELLVRTINATGGLVQLEENSAMVPNVDTDWLDLGNAAEAADRAIGVYCAGEETTSLVNPEWRMERLVRHEFVAE